MGSPRQPTPPPGSRVLQADSDPETAVTSDDRTLLRKTHAGHESSARQLWQRHAGWMLAFSRSILGPRPTIAPDDVVQSVFCTLLTLDRRTIRSVREVRPYLAQLTRREALNQLRAARRAAQREAALATADAAPPPRHDHPDLAAAIATLPRRLREVVHLRHVVGLTTDQTAEALDLPRGTVASRSRAAMRTLRDLLEDPAPVGEAHHALAD